MLSGKFGKGIAISILIFGILTFSWTFDFEIATSTSLKLDSISIEIEYHFREIGRTSEGFLSVDILNESPRVVKLFNVQPDMFFLIPGSPLKLPLTIPGGQMITLSALSSPVDMDLFFVFDTGSVSTTLNLSREYTKVKKEFFQKQLSMSFSFLVAIAIFFIARGIFHK
jgi:hypothetical protein